MTTEATMGGGPAREIIQFALPWPEPTAILDRIRKKYPHIEIRYFDLKWHTSPTAPGDFPVGMYFQALLSIASIR